MPDQPRTPGGIQCQWCPAKRICPEYQAAAASLALAIDDEIKDEGFTAIIRRSAGERGEHVRRLKEMQDNIKKILAQYVELAVKEGAGTIKGYTLRRKLIRDVTSEAEAMRLTRSRWNDEAVYAALTFSVAKLEDHLAEKGIGKKKAKELVSEVLGGVMSFKKSEQFLAESRVL
jgi:hypothetical protein